MKIEVHVRPRRRASGGMDIIETASGLVSGDSGRKIGATVLAALMRAQHVWGLIPSQLAVKVKFEDE